MNKTIFDNIQLEHGNPIPLGATVISPDCVNFAFICDNSNNAGIILYNRAGKKVAEIQLDESYRTGNVYSCRLSNFNFEKYEYNFYSADEIIPDTYSKKIIGNEVWGKLPTFIRNGFETDEFDWENDRKPLTSLNDSIIYSLHVRGFSKHKSSKVTNPGTFSGIVSKIDYLKDLGITAVELMPAYNFIEYEHPSVKGGEFAESPYESIVPKLNYWGYKSGYYFAPKQSYSEKGVDCVKSFKNLVKELHKNGIEIIMQFFFPESINRGYIYEVIKFWANEYHVDGFHLMGNKLPLSLLATDPLLSETKLFCENFVLEDIYAPGVVPNHKNLAICRDDYMYDMRRLLKSDEGMASKALSYIKDIPLKTGDIHYFAHSNTFTLNDVVSYDRKHNEENGENNRDGAVYNASWNCGYEGPSSRKTVNRLRTKQIKNAVVLNMLSKSTPLMAAGDEFCNSQKGNNNPYCIDSPVTWLNWGNILKYSDIYEFTKNLIGFRKKYKILHTDRSFAMNDYKQCGYPDVSFHSEEPWRVDLDPLSRQFGILYDGEYEGDDVFIYVAVNLHWTAHSFAVPKIPAGYKWSLFVSTDEALDCSKIKETLTGLDVRERSITIIVAQKD